MSLELNRDELERDPYLAACLRAAEGEVPMEEVDWVALRQAVTARAELPLQRLRSDAARRPRRRWTGPVVSLAAAACIATVALVGGLDGGTSTGVTESGEIAIAPGVTIEDALRGNLSDQEFGNVISGRANADALLRIAANSD